MSSANHRLTGTDTGLGSLRVSRRGLLAVGAVGASATALAGCSQAASPGTGGAGQPGSGGSSTQNGPLAKLADIKIGEAISATGADGAKIIIARPTETTVAAFSAICTHQACLVKPAGKELDCPCHGSVYNATTGEVIDGPAPRPLPKVDVTISGDNIIAG
jgi:Rieske Fe-S protein